MDWPLVLQWVGAAVVAFFVFGGIFYFLAWIVDRLFFLPKKRKKKRRLPEAVVDRMTHYGESEEQAMAWYEQRMATIIHETVMGGHQPRKRPGTIKPPRKSA